MQTKKIVGSHPVGKRVIVSALSGINSLKTGTIIDISTIPTNGRGIPLLTGEYSPIDRKHQQAIKLDSGETILMFNNRIRLIDHPN